MPSRTQPRSPDWHALFTAIRAMIKPFPLPYVTRLSLKKYKNTNARAFAVLTATIVSLRTKDKVTGEASERLLGLADSPEKLLQVPVEEISRALYPAGFYRTKAGQLKKIAGLLIEKYGGCVPRDLERLTELPGVGRKTANLVLTEGFDIDGICVDTHVHRITNRLGLMTTTTPDATEMRLREILPRSFWKKINLWLVMFGQHHCKPVGPKCGECLLLSKCPWGQYAGSGAGVSSTRLKGR